MAKVKSVKSVKTTGGKSGKGPKVVAVETQVAEKTTLKKLKTDQLGVLMEVQTSRIDPASFQNCRTGDWQNAESSEVDTHSSGYKETRESIRQVGQKTACVVRKHPNPKSGFDFELIVGWQRWTAIHEIAQETGIKKPTIKIVVKELNDLQAQEENVLENTARDNLSSGDLGRAAKRLRDTYEANGIKMSVNKLAQRMGKNQSYLNQLLTIADVLEPKAYELWADPSQTIVSVAAMYELCRDFRKAESKGDKPTLGDQKTAIETLRSGKENKKTETPPNPDPPSPEATATAKAEATARMLAKLQFLGYIEVLAQAWEGLEAVSILGASPRSLTPPMIDRVCKAATKAYEKGLVDEQKAAEAAEKKAAEAANGTPAPAPAVKRGRGKGAPAAKAAESN